MRVTRECDWYLISLTSALFVLVAAIALGAWYVTQLLAVPGLPGPPPR